MNDDEKFRRRVLCAVVPAMLLPLAAEILVIKVLSDHPAMQAAYFASKVFTVAWVVFGVFVLIRGARPEQLRIAPQSRTPLGKSLMMGALVGLGIVAVMVVWMYSPLAYLVEAGALGVQEKVGELGFAGRFILLAGFITVFHSLLEEVYWRWFIYGNLRHVIARGWAHALAAIAFTGHHIVVTAEFFPLPFALFLSACVGIGGVIWSLLYERTNSLVAVWISHLLVDAGLMWVGFRLLQVEL